mgnify:CR=1 FL=1
MCVCERERKNVSVYKGEKKAKIVPITGQEIWLQGPTYSWPVLSPDQLYPQDSLSTHSKGD